MLSRCGTSNMYFENPAITYSETPVPAIHRNYAGAAGPPLLSGLSGAFLVSINGTGSSYSAEAYLTRCGGYDLFPIERATAMPLVDLSQRYVKLMRDIQSGFDRTLSRLPSVFGVSRQTLYNWRAGETPNLSMSRSWFKLPPQLGCFLRLVSNLPQRCWTVRLPTGSLF